MLICLMLIVFLLVAFPTTIIGKRLREWLVDLPARRLNDVTPGRVAFYLALGMMGFVLFCLFEADGVRLFSFLAPDLILWFSLFDVALFLDIFILSMTLVATTRVKAVRAVIFCNFQRVLISTVARVSGRERTTKPRTTRSDNGGKEEPDPVGFGVVLA